MGDSVTVDSFLVSLPPPPSPPPPQNPSRNSSDTSRVTPRNVGSDCDTVDGGAGSRSDAVFRTRRPNATSSGGSSAFLPPLHPEYSTTESCSTANGAANIKSTGRMRQDPTHGYKMLPPVKQHQQQRRVPFHGHFDDQGFSGSDINGEFPGYLTHDTHGVDHDDAGVSSDVSLAGAHADFDAASGDGISIESRLIPLPSWLNSDDEDEGYISRDGNQNCGLSDDIGVETGEIYVHSGASNTIDCGRSISNDGAEHSQFHGPKLGGVQSSRVATKQNVHHEGHDEGHDEGHNGDDNRLHALDLDSNASCDVGSVALPLQLTFSNGKNNRTVSTSIAASMTNQTLSSAIESEDKGTLEEDTYLGDYVADTTLSSSPCSTIRTNEATDRAVEIGLQSSHSFIGNDSGSTGFDNVLQLRERPIHTEAAGSVARSQDEPLKKQQEKQHKHQLEKQHQQQQQLQKEQQQEQRQEEQSEQTTLVENDSERRTTSGNEDRNGKTETISSQASPHMQSPPLAASIGQERPGSIEQLVELGERQMRSLRNSSSRHNARSQVPQPPPCSGTPVGMTKKPFLKKGSRREPSSLNKQRHGAAMHRQSSLSSSLEELEEMQRLQIEKCEQRMQKLKLARERRGATATSGKKEAKKRNPSSTLRQRRGKTQQGSMQPLRAGVGQRQRSDCRPMSSSRASAMTSRSSINNQHDGGFASSSTTEKVSNQGNNNMTSSPAQRQESSDDTVLEMSPAAKGSGRDASGEQRDEAIPESHIELNFRVDERQGCTVEGNMKTPDATAVSHCQETVERGSDFKLRNKGVVRARVHAAGNENKGSARKKTVIARCTKSVVKEMPSDDFLKRQMRQVQQQMQFLRKRQEEALRDAEKERDAVHAWAEAERASVTDWVQEQREMIERERHRAANDSLLAARRRGSLGCGGKQASHLSPTDSASRRMQGREIESLRATIQKLKSDKDSVTRRYALKEKRLAKIIGEKFDRIHQLEELVAALDSKRPQGDILRTRDNLVRGKTSPNDDHLAGPPVMPLSDFSDRRHAEASIATTSFESRVKKRTFSPNEKMMFGKEPSTTSHYFDQKRMSAKSGAYLERNDSIRSNESSEDDSYSIVHETCPLAAQSGVNSVKESIHSSNEEHVTLPLPEHHLDTQLGEHNPLPRKWFGEIGRANTATTIYPEQQIEETGLIFQKPGEKFSHVPYVGGTDEILSETRNGGTVEQIYADGRKAIVYQNGSHKCIFPDGRIVVRYPNGDVKTVLGDSGVEKYHYAKSNTTHTAFADGREVFEFANKQVEHHYPDGKKVIDFHDNTRKIIHSDGAIENVFPDGTTQVLGTPGPEHGHSGESRRLYDTV